MNGKRFTVSGRVQGVGFRDFVQKVALTRKITGYARNLPDGSVLVCAVGSDEALAELSALLRQGPPWASVRTVSSEDMPATEFDGFKIL